MDEQEAQFQLLLREMQSIQEGIRAYDAISFQVKGWCITLAGAAAGVALSSGRTTLIAIGMAATLAFWVVDAHYRSVQRVFFMRDRELEHALRGRPILETLGSGDIELPRLAGSFGSETMPRVRFAPHARWELSMAMREFAQPLTYNLYVLVMFALTALALIQALS